MKLSGPELLSAGRFLITVLISMLVIGLLNPEDGMGREAGGGIGMRNTCKSMADSCQCMAKNIKILYSN